MIVPVAFLVIVVIESLGLALFALGMPDNAKVGALADPEVQSFAVGGEEELRFGLDGLRSSYRPVVTAARLGTAMPAARPRNRGLERGWVVWGMDGLHLE